MIFYRFFCYATNGYPGYYLPRITLTIFFEQSLLCNNLGKTSTRNKMLLDVKKDHNIIGSCLTILCYDRHDDPLRKKHPQNPSEKIFRAKLLNESDRGKGNDRSGLFKRG